MSCSMTISCVIWSLCLNLPVMLMQRGTRLILQITKSSLILIQISWLASSNTHKRLPNRSILNMKFDKQILFKQELKHQNSNCLIQTFHFRKMANHRYGAFTPLSLLYCYITTCSDTTYVLLYFKITYHQSINSKFFPVFKRL